MVIPNLTVPVLNRYDLLERMCASLDYPVQHLLIIDNGGGIESWDKPDLVERLTVWRMPANFGVAASWNLAVKAFRNDDVFFFASNDVEFAPGGMEVLATARRDQVTLSESFPYFQAFAVGVDVVAKVGLFDENYFPAYCEDIDFLWRCEHHGVPVVKISVPSRHDNSSTINSDSRLRDANAVTHAHNMGVLQWKQGAGRAEALPFDVMRWRRQDWR